MASGALCLGHYLEEPNGVLALKMHCSSIADSVLAKHAAPPSKNTINLVSPLPHPFW